MSVRTALREPTDSHHLIQLPRQPAPRGDLGAMPADIEDAQAGDAGAFGRLYVEYYETVFRFIHFRVRNRQTAEDITADTFVRALRRLDTFTWQGRDIGAWLVTIARNLVNDHYKSRRVRYEVASVEAIAHELTEESTHDSPEQNAIDHLTHRDMLRAVTQLSADQQECIVLRFLHGLSVAETAQIMGRNEGAIKALQFRARNVLARMLTEGLTEPAAARPEGRNQRDPAAGPPVRAQKRNQVSREPPLRGRANPGPA